MENHGWIKASKEKPEYNVSVLVFIPEEDNHATVGMWDISKQWVLLDEYRIPSSQVTYWKPMIELPEDRSYKPTHIEQTTDELKKQTVDNMRAEIFRLKLKIRSNQIDLLNKFGEFLEKEGYTDTDWRVEQPHAVDEFLKNAPKP